LAWYDNEWGYANRLVELARTVAAYTDSDKVAMNVGFSYMANAGGG
jgi:hypothetical protein